MIYSIKNGIINCDRYSRNCIRHRHGMLHCHYMLSIPMLLLRIITNFTKSYCNQRYQNASSTHRSSKADTPAGLLPEDYEPDDARQNHLITSFVSVSRPPQRSQSLTAPARSHMAESVSHRRSEHLLPVRWYHSDNNRLLRCYFHHH